MWFKLFTLMAGASVCLNSATVSAAESGFIEDSSTSVGLRNFYWNADNRNGSYRNPEGERQSYRQEWAQGVLAKFNSGYTQGLIGFGMDLHYMGALKLDGGNGRVGGHVASDHSDAVADLAVCRLAACADHPVARSAERQCRRFAVQGGTSA